MFVLIGYSLWRIYAFLRQTRKVETFRKIVEKGIDADGLGRFDDELEEGKGRGWCVGDFETAGDRDGFGWGSGGEGAKEDFPDKLLGLLRRSFDRVQKESELSYSLLMGMVVEEELMDEV